MSNLERALVSSPTMGAPLVATTEAHHRQQVECYLAMVEVAESEAVR